MKTYYFIPQNKIQFIEILKLNPQFNADINYSKGLCFFIHKFEDGQSRVMIGLSSSISESDIDLITLFSPDNIYKDIPTIFRELIKE